MDMSTKINSRKKILSVVWDVLFYLFIACILIFVFSFAVDKSPEKSIFGYRLYEAMTDSMRPEINKGDLVIVKITGPADVKAGDVITYAADDIGAVTVTHRIVSINSDAQGERVFITKGDRNETRDEPVHQNRVIGKVVFNLPHAGFVVGFIRQNALLCLLITLILILGGYGVVCLLKGRKGQNAVNAEATNAIGRELSEKTEETE